MNSSRTNKYSRILLALTMAFSMSACAPNKPQEKSWKAYYDDGNFQSVQQNYEEAVKQYQLALDHLHGAEYENDWRAEILARMARHEVILGNLNEADQLTDQAIKISTDKSLQGANHGEVLVALDDLAEAYNERGVKLDEGKIRCLKKALELRQPPVTLRKGKAFRRCAKELAVEYILSGQQEKAEPLLDEAIKSEKEEVGFASVRDIACAYKIAGNEEQSKKYFDLGLSMVKKRNPEIWMRHTFVCHVAKIYLSKKRFEEAEKLILEYSSEIKPAPAGNDMNRALASAYEGQGKLKQADAIYENLVTEANLASVKKKERREILENYARYLRRTNREKEAKSVQKKADSLRDTSF